MSTTARRWVLAVFIALAAAGYLLPFWPLSVLGVLLIALSGRWFVAILIGLLLDLAWGAPLGTLHVLYFPFTILAVVAALARLLGAKYFINRAPSERL